MNEGEREVKKLSNGRYKKPPNSHREICKNITREQSQI